MTLRRFFTAISLLSPLAGPASARAQTIAGRVLDDFTGAPISTAVIMLLDSTDVAVAWAESDSVGRFLMSAPRAGVYRLYADRLAYSKIFSETFPLSAIGSVELSVHMVPLPMELDVLVVTAERRRVTLEAKGFYRRRETSIGYFLDLDEIEQLKPLRVTDLMRNLPGVYVQRSRLGGDIPLTHRFGRYCPMKVILDGFKMDVADGSLDNWVASDRVIGMEVYPSGVGAPVQYRGLDSRCGIVMIWTR